jgi:hypothetical protein
MATVGGLQIPDELLVRTYALELLRKYFRRDEHGYVYSGAVFDTYPTDPACGARDVADTANQVNDSDLVALSLLGIHVTGYAALAITQYHAPRIRELLSAIPADARIETKDSEALLARGAPAWRLWELLRDIQVRASDSRFGAVAAGKLLARKRPGLIPIEDSKVACVFGRPAPDRDERWWDDVRTAMLDRHVTANGTTFLEYLDSFRDAAGLGHLPLLRVLDIIGWMHATEASGSKE